MTQFENNIHTNSATLLRQLLRLIAHKPNLNEVAPVVLAEVRRVIDASAGFYLLFDAPQGLFLDSIVEEQMPEIEALHALVQSLDSEIYLSSDLPVGLARNFSKWLLVPIFHKQNAIAVLSLLFKANIELDETVTELLMALIDGLAIATRDARVSAHHEKLMRNQNEFVRIVSHDLRSPLTSMKGFASMLESQMVGDLNDKQLHFVEKILAGIAQMTSLVDNIQDAGRYDPETGFYEMERTPTDLLEVVHKIVNNYLLPAEKQELALQVNSAAGDIPIVNVDSTMLERSISNLVDNAIKYTPNGGRIDVDLRREEDNLVITISDTGYGISEEDMRQLFQRHYRIRRREHKRVKGSGLGLFIVRSVARQHGGDAYVESVEGEGSTFGIRIPLVGENLLGPGMMAKDV